MAIEAFALLKKTLPQRPMHLDVAGEGALAGALRALAARLVIGERTQFVGALNHPEPFMPFIDRQDIVVLSNLNHEQPRIVFDAICPGSVVMCPKSPVYPALGLSPAVLYEHGNAQALAECLLALVSGAHTALLRQALRALLDEATIKGMHSRRRKWISSAVLRVGHS